MAFRWFLAINILALTFLASSFILGIALRKLMGKGKDTAPIQILLIVIIMNTLLGALLLGAGYMAYLGNFVNYTRITGVVLMLIGIILTGSMYKVYKNYKKLILRQEPDK